MQNTYRLSVGKTLSKEPLGRSRRRWMWTGFIWLRIGTRCGLLWTGYLILKIKVQRFFKPRHNVTSQKTRIQTCISSSKGSAPWSQSVSQSVCQSSLHCTTCDQTWSTQMSAQHVMCTKTIGPQLHLTWTIYRCDTSTVVLVLIRICILDFLRMAPRRRHM